MMEGGAVKLLEFSECWVTCVVDVLEYTVLDDKSADDISVVDVVNVVVEGLVEDDWMEYSSSVEEVDVIVGRRREALPAA